LKIPIADYKFQNKKKLGCWLASEDVCHEAFDFVACSEHCVYCFLAFLCEFVDSFSFFPYAFDESVSFK